MHQIKTPQPPHTTFIILTIVRPTFNAFVRSGLRLQSTLVQPVTSAQQLSSSIGSSKVSVVDFHAEWCGPCKQMAPIIDQLASSYSEKPVKFFKVDIDEVQEAAMQHEVSAVPTFVIFKDGKISSKIVGANPQGLKKGIEDSLL